VSQSPPKSGVPENPRLSGGEYVKNRRKMMQKDDIVKKVVDGIKAKEGALLA
jgi:hypothetical protein